MDDVYLYDFDYKLVTKLYSIYNNSNNHKIIHKIKHIYVHFPHRYTHNL